MAVQAANTTFNYTTSVHTVKDFKLEDKLEFEDVVPKFT